MKLIQTCFSYFLTSKYSFYEIMLIEGDSYLKNILVIIENWQSMILLL